MEMEELLPFLQQNENWIYILLGAIALIYLFKMVSAFKEWKETVFGLERESAQRRFTSSLTILVLLVLFVLAEFTIVTFVAPAYPQLAALSTPTLDVLATPTVTLAASTPAATSTASGFEMPTITATTEANGCIPGQIEWVSPGPGQEINQTIELIGTVNVPNLGFYKYEFSQQGSEVWNTIAANNTPKVGGEIGYWNTSQLTPGDYLLRLVVVDNQNQPFPDCVVPVRVLETQN